MIQPYVVILKLNLYILLRDIEELQYHRYELHDFGKVYLCVHNICYVYIKFLRCLFVFYQLHVVSIEELLIDC